MQVYFLDFLQQVMVRVHVRVFRGAFFIFFWRRTAVFGRFATPPRHVRLKTVVFRRVETDVLWTNQRCRATLGRSQGPQPLEHPPTILASSAFRSKLKNACKLPQLGNLRSSAVYLEGNGEQRAWHKTVIFFPFFRWQPFRKKS